VNGFWGSATPAEPQLIVAARRRRLARRVAVAIAAALAIALTRSVSAGPEFSRYRNSEYRFAFEFPGSSTST
jgi:hypothetical protein